MEALLIGAIAVVSLVSGIASARIGYRMGRNPGAADRRNLSPRELDICRWLLPAGLFVLGAIFPLFYFSVRSISRRSQNTQ